MPKPCNCTPHPRPCKLNNALLNLPHYLLMTGEVADNLRPPYERRAGVIQDAMNFSNDDGQVYIVYQAIAVWPPTVFW